MSAKKAQKEQEPIRIDRIPRETILVPITGTAPLCIHRMSEKDRKKMLDNMTGVKRPKEPRDPQAEYEAARYRFEDGGDGITAIAFKLCMSSAARFYGKNVTMVGLLQFIFVIGESGLDGRPLVRIGGSEPRMREDPVGVGQGTDLRWRPYYEPWSAVLRVEYVCSVLDRGSVLSLIDGGGFGVGVGEMRPEKKGDFGTFQIDIEKEIEVVAP